MKKPDGQTFRSHFLTLNCMGGGVRFVERCGSSPFMSILLSVYLTRETNGNSFEKGVTG